MVRVLMHGCCGAMGRVITGLAADREDLKIVAGVDRNTDDSLGYPVFQSLEACDVGATVTSRYVFRTKEESSK